MHVIVSVLRLSYFIHIPIYIFINIQQNDMVKRNISMRFVNESFFSYFPIRTGNKYVRLASTFTRSTFPDIITIYMQKLSIIQRRAFINSPIIILIYSFFCRLCVSCPLRAKIVWKHLFHRFIFATLIRIISSET